jgi:hypothetical protein
MCSRIDLYYLYLLLIFFFSSSPQEDIHFKKITITIPY